MTITPIRLPGGDPVQCSPADPVVGFDWYHAGATVQVGPYPSTGRA